jgi:hypothetical protein
VQPVSAAPAFNSAPCDWRQLLFPVSDNYFSRSR